MIRRLAGMAAVTAVLGGMLALGAAVPANADTNDFSFESFTGDYDLGRDAQGYSTLRVKETLVALFPATDQNHGILRDIPTYDYTTRVDSDFHLVSVTDGSGTKVPVQTSTENGITELRIGSADSYAHGRTTYVIEYTERYAARYFSDTDDDEFYWDINGSAWAQQFGTVTAHVHLADGLASKLNGGTSCYPPPGSQPCTLERSSDGFTTTISDVSPYSTLTLAIGFRPHTFTAAPTTDDAWQVRVLPWVLLGILLAVVLAIVACRLFVWRDARGTGIIVPQYVAPEDLGVWQAAYLLHRGNTGLPASIVNFAVQDAAKLIEDDKAAPDQRYRLELVKADALPNADDQRVLTKLMDGKDSLVLDTGDEALGDRIASLSAEEQATIRTQKYTAGARGPVSVILRLVTLAALAGGVYAFFWASSNDAGSGLFPLQLLVLAIGGVLALRFAGAPVRLTAKGTAAREQLLGLQLYLKLAEADRLKMLQSPTGAERERIDPTDESAVVKLYEKLLPWAMVWGIEAQWAKVLGAHYATTPVATTNLNFAGTAFLLDLGAFSHSMQPTSFSTTPPVASSSSFSGSSFGGSFGGGFSGGGGGGGGGGGW